MKSLGENNKVGSMESYLTKKEVAQLLKLCPRTVNRYLAMGMPHYKFGNRRVRFLASEVHAWVRERFHTRRIGPATVIN